jgi:hypothetical protein
LSGETPVTGPGLTDSGVHVAYWKRTVGTGARRVGTFLTAAVAVLALGGTHAQAADSTNLGRRYDDGLDTRLSALRLRDATAALGYASGASTVGRSANDAWSDGLSSAVFGLFGHANGGLFQLDEAPAGETDSWLIAGRSTDVLPPSSNTRAVSEYLPFLDVDDMRLLVLAGCYTANPGVNGDFLAMAEEKGIDSVVGFTGLVSYPATAPAAAISTTDYAGNYFWGRFSSHAAAGADVRTSLARARTDLVTKEGVTHGWDRYVVGGAVADPGAVRLAPAGNGQLLDSAPVATVAYASLAALPVASTSRSQGPGGLSLTDVRTTAGVSYRMTDDGTILDAVGVPSTSGDIGLSIAQARAIAAEFLTAHTGTPLLDWSMHEERTTDDGSGAALATFTWRPASSGISGPARIDIDVARRTGAVVYYAATQPLTPPDRATDPISRADALAAVAGVVDTDGARVEATPEVWDRAFWLVTVDRGLDDGFPDVDQLRVDAVTGRIASHVTT